MRVSKINTKSNVWTPGTERVMTNYFSEEKGQKIDYDKDIGIFRISVGDNPDNYVDVLRENVACCKFVPAMKAAK